MQTESLPCRLTDAEVMDRTRKLLDVLSEEDRLELEKKSFAERHKEAVTIVTAKARELRGIVSSRIEYREVEVAESPDYKRGIVEVIRIDTSEIVRTRQMSSEERQSPLFEAEARSRA
jgi:hypothetical protein